MKIIFLYLATFILLLALALPQKSLASMTGTKRVERPENPLLQDDREIKFPKDALALSADILRKSLSGAVNGSWEDSALAIQFQNRQIPIQVKNRFPEVEFIVEGDPPCLRFQTHLLKKTGYIDLIYIENNNCPFLKEKAGTTLLNLVDAITTALGLKEVQVLDHSSIYLGNTGLKTNLRLLRTIREGLGWYESRGYRPVDSLESDQITREKYYIHYRQEVERFLEYPLAYLIACLEAFRSEDIETLEKNFFRLKWPIIKTKLETEGTDVACTEMHELRYKRFFREAEENRSKILLELMKAKTHEKLGQFLDWLSRDNPAQYLEVVEFLLPLETLDLDIDLGLRTYGLFPKAGMHVKNFPELN